MNIADGGGDKGDDGGCLTASLRFYNVDVMAMKVVGIVMFAMTVLLAVAWWYNGGDSKVWDKW